MPKGKRANLESLLRCAWERQQRDNMHSSPHRIALPKEKTPGQKLLDFLEHGWVITSVATVGTLVGFVYTPVLTVCGVAILLAFHRVGVVRGQRRSVQIAAYGGLFLLTTLALYKADRTIKGNLPHIPTAKEIAAVLLPQLEQEVSVNETRPASTQAFKVEPPKTSTGRKGEDDLPTAVLFTSRLDFIRPEVGSPLVLDAHCENAGPSVAFDAGQISNVASVDANPLRPDWVSPETTDWLYRSLSYAKSLGTGTVPVGPCTHYKVLGPPLTADFKRQLDTGAKLLVWAGISVWRDEHGKFKFEQCYWRHTNGQWGICQNHNGVRITNFKLVRP